MIGLAASGAALLLIRCGAGDEGVGRDDDGIIDTSRYAPERRELDDPRVAHVRGTITHEGRPVSNAIVQAIVHPIGYHGATSDVERSGGDGKFAIAITGGNLYEKQPVELTVNADGMRGRATVMLSPSERMTEVRIEVGQGVTVRGRVTNAHGGRVGRYDMGRVGVCLGAACSEATDDGAFELYTYELGRQRFEVHAGGVTFSVKELPLARVAPSLTIERLSGSVGPIVLQVDEDAAEGLFNEPSWDLTKNGWTALVRVIPVRGAALPESIMCMTPHGGENFAVGDGRHPIEVPVVTFYEHSRIDCESNGSLEVRVHDPALGRVVDVPIVQPAIDEVDLGVELRRHPEGARVLDVADEAKQAGLLAGDVVTAVDGIAVANMRASVVRALGFRLPPGQATTLTVHRGREELSIRVVAPPAH